MNRKKALEELSKYLQEYCNSGFIFHNEFISDFQVLIKEVHGHETELFQLLIKQLAFVKELGCNVFSADSNEILKYGSYRLYYSLHLQSKIFNIRIIMTFHENIPVFLVAFYERAGKKHTDYSVQKDPVINRYNELFKEDII